VLKKTVISHMQLRHFEKSSLLSLSLSFTAVAHKHHTRNFVVRAAVVDTDS
jgi:hypothetical protein